MALLILFWLSLAALLWAFVGYPATMLARAAFGRRSPAWPEPAAPPPVSVVLAVRNAAGELADRVRNLLEQDYPADLLEVLVVSNGSTDETVAVAAHLAEVNSRVRTFTTPGEQRKAGALNAGAAAARGQVLVFADARQRFRPDAVTELVRALGDPAVGAVSGRLLIARSDVPAVAGVGSYWQLETQLRLAESETGSVIGATGAIYAVKRDVFAPLPPSVILDDVYQPMAVVRQGYRVILNPRAIAHDRPSPGYRAEYARRVRTLVGNYELLRLMPWLLSPVRNPVFLRFVSHKLLRLLTPVFCFALLLSGALLPGIGYRLVAAALAALYVLGAAGLLVRSRALALPSAFLLLHVAGIAALLRPHRPAAEVWIK